MRLNEQQKAKDDGRSTEFAGEKLKNALIYGIMELSKDERKELLALWKEMKSHGV